MGVSAVNSLLTKNTQVKHANIAKHVGGEQGYAGPDGHTCFINARRPVSDVVTQSPQ
jgi:hypothetical protein